MDADTTIEEIAALVSRALDAAGIDATLSGGAAVSIYTENEYESADLDFVTSARNEMIATALAPLGFEYRPGRREFYHPDAKYYLEFPSGPLAFGETLAEDDATIITTKHGPIRIITPTQTVMDRLTPYIHWRDPQAFEQAVMVARRHEIDWETLASWAAREGASSGLLERLRRRARRD